MSVSATTATNSSSSTSNADLLNSLNDTNGATGEQTLTETDFFQLLTAQLAAQDPLQPMDDTSFISQMATFSSLQQMQTLSDNVTSLTSQQGVANANDYLGKTVSVTDANGAAVTGVVSAISISAGTPSLVINGTSYGVDTVTNVTSNQQTTDSASNTNAQ